MFCLSKLSISKTIAQAPLPDDSPPTNSNSPKLPTRRMKTTILPRKKLRPRPQQPTVIQIERIIGAGSFRDGEPGDSDQRKSVFDMSLLSPSNPFEGPVEKKLRETGEWVTTNTENKFRSSGKRILMFVLQWVLPIWSLSLLVASGVVKLPFSTKLLDDLIM
ncbi:Chlororespiratory reduction 3 [Quillaja saponaria]|uniref:Chlororespiratory reduction 3 n=1 Tax=Quillaja saponaria TaxID=32244 RepID=A0AAD7KNX0_QUISA|nr:Chlororespiratory reduction 3 [Quillaja saponaria]